MACYKNLLNKRFWDQRNEDSLLSNLSALKQAHNENSLQFYSRDCSTHNLLHNFINLLEIFSEAIESKKIFFNSHALHTLFVSLRSPKLLCFRLLAEVQQHILRDHNIRILKSGNSKFSSKQTLTIFSNTHSRSFFGNQSHYPQFHSSRLLIDNDQI